MKSFAPQNPKPHASSGGRSRLLWILAVCSLVIILLGLLRSLRKDDLSGTSTEGSTQATTAESRPSAPGRFSTLVPHRPSISGPASTAEEIVTNKVVQFARGRREIVHTLARHFKVEVPAEVERFFDAAEAGRWDDLKAIYTSLREGRTTQAFPADLYRTLWPAVLETYGVAEVAHDWPAQKLLDYGQAVLGSLRPGMVYLGGTDPGRFIPTLLNETTDGERHIVLTQNAFADGTYLDYIGFLYGDRLATLTKDDSQHAFQEYLSDAQERFIHDQQFPNEPKLLRPGEDVRMIDNRIQVSGQVDVMEINEKLLQTLLQKNPDVSFALEESFPLKSTYLGAVPLGPIMELRAPYSQIGFTAERAAQALDYWRDTAQSLQADPEAPASSDTRKAYAQMAMAQANLFADHN